MCSSRRRENPFGPKFKEIVADPSRKHYKNIGNAIWLFLYLLYHANPGTGKVVITIAEVANEIGQKDDTVRCWLGQLKRGQYIAQKGKNIDVTVKICCWSELLNSSFQHIEERSSPTTKKAGKTSTKGKALPTEQSKLAEYVAKELEVTHNLTEFIKRVQGAPRTVVVKSYSEVIEIPDSKIKKSRSALFLYLIKKYEQEQ